MKRLCGAILALAMVFSLGACAPAETTWQEQYDLGLRYLSEGNYEQAIIAFTAAIEIDPKQPETYLSLADAYMAQGDTESAKAVLEEGLETTDSSDIGARLEELSAQAAVPEPTPTPTPEPTPGPEGPSSSVAAGGTLQYQGWRSIDSSYFALCENILMQYWDKEYAELAEYIQTEVVIPIRTSYPAEKITFYYGELTADGVPDGFGISIYTEEERSTAAAYVGTFSQGMRDGQGLLIESYLYPGWYIGGWEADFPNGYGEEYMIMEDRVKCKKGDSIGGLADGYWLECWYKDGSLPVEDGDRENGVTIAGYRYLCEKGFAVSMGPVPETATIEWGIPASDLMTQFYIVYEDGTETYEPAPHEHAGGMACSICQEGGTPGFLHAYVPSSTSRWLFDFNARYG